MRLYISDFILAEIRELPTKIRSKFISFDQVENLTDTLMQIAVFVKEVPAVYTHPIDPDDSAYINLALAADAKLIVSRDRHLLGMMHDTASWSAEFRQRFPQLKILAPDTFVELLRLEENRAP